LKNAIQKILNKFGFELRRIEPFPPGSPNRSVGSMRRLLEDLKVRGLSCHAIMDVGANRGHWSAMAKVVFPEARFCLIEPQIEMEGDLRSFCDQANNSVYYIAGAGAVASEKYLTIWDDLAGSSFLPSEDEQLKGAGKQRKISIVTIDSIVKNDGFDIPGLVKLDIQGYEIEALKGADSLFGQTEVFILEVSLFSFADNPGMPVLADIINFMLERNYVIYDFPGFSRRPLDGALGQCDICFVKKDGFLRASNKWGG